MKVSIGIMLRNEEARVAKTLSVLLQQSIFSMESVVAEVWCVVNGSTDSTAEIAKATAERFVPRYGCVHIAQLATAGKINAWNEFVHRFSKRNAEIVIFMDADITLCEPDIVQKLLESLLEDPHAWAAVSTPVKHLTHKQDLSLFDRLSLQQSKAAMDQSGWICGHLYAIRAKVAREIVLPRGLLVEDGFLALMLTHDLFTPGKAANSRRVIHPANVWHIFNAYTSPRQLLRQGRRQAIAHTLSIILYEWLVKHRGPTSGARAIRDELERDPNWFLQLIATRLRERWWVIPRGSARGRLKLGMARYQSDGLIAVMHGIAGFAWALTTGFMANLYLRRGLDAQRAW